MSESVRYFLESRVPELEDLFKKGLFSKDEIKEIVAKRTKFEHKIKRRGAIIEDFLAYIQYETDLEQTRKQRYEMLNIRSKHSISDHSIVKYILSLYRRAVTKFRGNMPLWDQYINFARESKSDKSMPKILASALQLHPESVDIWIKAAKWELIHLNNPASARALFLRGIRINKESKPLWFEYFRMELEVANTLAEKKLQLSEINDEEKTEITVFDGAIAISIFKFAAKECLLKPEDVYEYYKLSLEYENLKTVTQFIDSFANENMSDKFIFLVSQARDEVSAIDFNDDDSTSRFEKCMKLLNSVITHDPLSTRIISDVVDVLKLLLQKSCGHSEISSMIFMKINHIFEAGEKSNILTPKNYISWINIAQSIAENFNFESILQKALRKFPENSILLQMKVSCDFDESNLDLSSLISSYSAMLKSNPENCSDSLNSFFKKYFDVVSSDLMKLAVLVVSQFVPSSQAIEYILKYGSDKEIFKSFDHLKMTPEFNSILIKSLIEKKIFSEDSKKFVSKLSIFSSKLFSSKESALALIHFSLIIGDIELCNRLFAKATSSLPPSSMENFLNLFEELKDSNSVFLI
jgi:hypothetical protein